MIGHLVFHQQEAFKSPTNADLFLSTDPFFKMIVESMKEYGCEVTPSFFKCRPCPVNAGGYYDSKLGVRAPNFRPTLRAFLAPS